MAAPDTAPVERLLDAVLQRDFAGCSSCLAADVSFKALLPDASHDVDDGARSGVAARALVRRRHAGRGGRSRRGHDRRPRVPALPAPPGVRGRLARVGAAGLLHDRRRPRRRGRARRKRLPQGVVARRRPRHALRAAAAVVRLVRLSRRQRAGLRALLVRRAVRCGRRFTPVLVQARRAPPFHTILPGRDCTWCDSGMTRLS